MTASLKRYFKARKLKQDRDRELSGLFEFARKMISGHGGLSASSEYYRSVEDLVDEHGNRIVREYFEDMKSLYNK